MILFLCYSSVFECQCFKNTFHLLKTYYEASHLKKNEKVTKLALLTVFNMIYNFIGIFKILFLISNLLRI